MTYNGIYLGEDMGGMKILCFYMSHNEYKGYVEICKGGSDGDIIGIISLNFLEMDGVTT